MSSIKCEKCKHDFTIMCLEVKINEQGGSRVLCIDCLQDFVNELPIHHEFVLLRGVYPVSERF